MLEDLRSRQRMDETGEYAASSSRSSSRSPTSILPATGSVPTPSTRPTAICRRTRSSNAKRTGPSAVVRTEALDRGLRLPDAAAAGMSEEKLGRDPGGEFLGALRMNVTLVLNPNAGRLRGLDPEKAAEAVAAIFRAHGHHVKTEILAGDHAVAAIARIYGRAGAMRSSSAAGTGQYRPPQPQPPRAGLLWECCGCGLFSPSPPPTTIASHPPSRQIRAIAATAWSPARISVFTW